MTLSSAGKQGAKIAPSDVSERNLFALPERASQDVPQVREALRCSTPGNSGEPATQKTHGPLKLWEARKTETTKRAWRAVSGAVVLELERGAAFLLVPVFLSVGVVAYFSLQYEPSWTSLLGMTVLATGAVWLSRHRYSLQLCLLALLLCLVGIWLSRLETWRLGTRIIGAEISVRLTGRVVEIEDMASGRKRLTLDVISTERPKLRYQPERVRLSARKVSPDIGPGSDVTGLVRLLPPAGPIRPGSYDTSFAAYFSGIGASGFFLSGPELSSHTAAPVTARIGAAIERARQTIAGRIRQSVGGPEGEIAAALIVGVRAGIPEKINEAMRKTGLYHIISISGLHMALVAGTVMGLMRGLFALFPDFSSRRPVKKYAALTALLATVAYLLISGMVVAAVRSFIMLAVMLIAVLFDRSALTMRNLAISAIIVIVVTPHEVVGPSFQMSFAATAALVGAYAAWSDYRTRRVSAPVPARRSLAGTLLHRLLVMMLGLAATSMVAGAATTLYAAWHFQRVAPLSLLANLAVMPVVSIIVMPFAVFASIAMPLGLDGPFLYVMGQGLTVMIYLSERIADMSPLDAVGLISATSVLFATLALVVGTMATTWLRWVSLPFAIMSLATLAGARAPDILVSEDARLLAVVMGDGTIAVNRPRPNAFTIDNWGRALDAQGIQPPERLKQWNPDDLPPKMKGESKGIGAGTGFRCVDRVCIVRHPSGARIVQAPDADSARAFCTTASLIVIEDATARSPCHNAAAAVITRRQLAQKGSAEIFLSPGSLPGRAASTGSRPEIRFSIEGDYRPWHTQRRFSREARGMPPYERKKPASSANAPEKTIANEAD